MEALVKMISDKTGISQDQAATAVNMIASFLKDKMPGGIGSQVESFLKSGGNLDSLGSLGDVTDSLKGKLGGMF